MKQKPSSRRRSGNTKSILRLPDPEHAKATVFNSADAKRGYRHAIDEFASGESTWPRFPYRSRVDLAAHRHFSVRKRGRLLQCLQQRRNLAVLAGGNDANRCARVARDISRHLLRIGYLQTAQVFALRRIKPARCFPAQLRRGNPDVKPELPGFGQIEG